MMPRAAAGKLIRLVPRSAYAPRYISPRRAAFAGIFVVTGLGLLSVGATLPVIPRYVQGPIGGSDFSVGLVTGAFAITGSCLSADRRQSRRSPRPTPDRDRSARSSARSPAPSTSFPPAFPGLVVARLFLGAGEGLVYTAGSAWVVDLAPPEKRGRIIGFYGLAIWSGLTLGPPIGELLLRASSFEMVWAFAMAAPLLGAVIAWRIPETFKITEPEPVERRSWIERKSLLPGMGLALGTSGLRGGRGVPRPPPGRAQHRPRSGGVRRLRGDRVPGPAPRRLAAGPLWAGSLHHRHRHRRSRRPRRDHARRSRFPWRSPAPSRWARRSRFSSRPSPSWS